VEFFAIRCSINQVIQIHNITHITVITDAIHSAKIFFNPHPYQPQSTAISQVLRVFIKKDSNNSVAFWDCFSSIYTRCSSHQDGSLQNGLGDVQTCGTTLASAYVLCCLSAMWLQLQIVERSLRWE